MRMAGGAWFEYKNIYLDRNRGLVLQQVRSDCEGCSATHYILEVELGGAVTYEYNVSKT